MALCLDYQSVYYQKRERIGSWPYMLLAAISLLLVLSFKIWIGIQITAVGYEIAEQQERTIRLDMDRRESELQLSILTRPDNLARRAQQVLGLQALNPHQARKIVR